MSQRRENIRFGTTSFAHVSGGLALEFIGGHRTQIAAVERVPDSDVTGARRRLSSITDSTSVPARCERIYSSVARSDSRRKTNGRETLDDRRNRTLRH
jgi:hypothetical protein